MADKGKTAKIVGIGCALFLLVAACCGGIGAYAFTQMQEPARYAHGFLKDVREANFPQALGRMDAPYQNTHDVNAFTQGVSSLPALTSHTDAQFSGVNISNGTATLNGQLVGPMGNTPVSLVLVSHGPHWYVTQVTVSGIPLP